MSDSKYTPEPFGYFKAEPFGWTDCSDTEDGAIPLFDKVTIRSIQKQRDELLEALEGMVKIARLTIGWSCTPANADGPLVVAERLIASVKGGA